MSPNPGYEGFLFFSANTVLCQTFSKLEQTSQSPGVVKRDIFGFTYRIAELVGLKWDTRICISNKFPDAVDAPGLGHTI